MLSQSTNDSHLDHSKSFGRYMILIILTMGAIGVSGILYFQSFGKKTLIGSALRNYANFSALQLVENIGELEDPETWAFQARKLANETYSEMHVSGITTLTILDIHRNVLAHNGSSDTCQQSGLKGEAPIIYNNQSIGYVIICNESFNMTEGAEFLDFNTISSIAGQTANDVSRLVAGKFSQVIAAQSNPEFWEFSLDHINQIAEKVLHLNGIFQLRLFNKHGKLLVTKRSKQTNLQRLTTITEHVIFNGQLFGYVELELDYQELRRINKLFSLINIFFVIAFSIIIYVFPTRVLQHLEKRAKKTDSELRETQTHLVQAGKLSALGEMAAGIAHEINNPLTIMRGYCLQLERISNQEPFDRQKLREVTAKIGAVITRIASIVRGLKTLSRDGRADPYSAIEIHPLIEETISLCSDRLRSLNIKTTVNSHGTLPDEKLIIEGRPSELSQVILNLLSNSIDAIEQYEEKWIQILILNNKDWIELKLVDCGPGIPPEVVKKLFDPFFTTKGVGKGTGLGLSISTNIIKNHHGELKIDAQAKNTCFVIRLPKIQPKSVAA